MNAIISGKSPRYTDIVSSGMYGQCVTTGKTKIKMLPTFKFGKWNVGGKSSTLVQNHDPDSSRLSCVAQAYWSVNSAFHTDAMLNALDDTSLLSLLSGIWP